jgi:hypothetical protein
MHHSESDTQETAVRSGPASADHHANILKAITALQSCDSAVGTATGYGLAGKGAGVRVAASARIFFHLSRPNRFWGSLRLLSKGYRSSFPGGEVVGARSLPLTYN